MQPMMQTTEAPTGAARPAPGRARPFEKTQAPTPFWLRKLLGRDQAPSREEFAAVCDATWEGDPAMDALVEWMFTWPEGPRAARALFDQALAEGVPADAPAPLLTFFKSVERTPAWVDREAIEDGVVFIQRVGAAAPYVLRDLSLMGGYLLSGFNQSLVQTGALNTGTARRLAETGKWWMDCTTAGGLERFGPGFATTLHVRRVHSLVRRHLARSKDWDHAHWGLPLNQMDMVCTYLGFSVVMLLGLRKIGIPVTRRESRGVMQLWSYACWLMGVDERWIRLRESEASVLLHHGLMTQSMADWTSKELGHALSREPLERHYPRLQTLRRRLAYHLHLSMSGYFLSRGQMASLGLPARVSGWFPAVTLLPRFVFYSAQRLVPGLNRWQQHRGRAVQRALLASLFGDAEHDVIQPDADHPAHL